MTSPELLRHVKRVQWWIVCARTQVHRPHVVRPTCTSTSLIICQVVHAWMLCVCACRMCRESKPVHSAPLYSIRLCSCVLHVHVLYLLCTCYTRVSLCTCTCYAPICTCRCTCTCDLSCEHLSVHSNSEDLGNGLALEGYKKEKLGWRQRILGTQLSDNMIFCNLQIGSLLYHYTRCFLFCCSICQLIFTSWLRSQFVVLHSCPILLVY